MKSKGLICFGAAVAAITVWSQGVIVFPISVGAWSESEPSISFGYVVWTSDRDAATTGLDIWGTDLRFADNFPICQDPGDQYHPAVNKWGSDVLTVWQDDRAATAPDVYGRFLSAPGSFSVAASPLAESFPRAWGRNVVYQLVDHSSGLTDIWGCFLPTKLNLPLVTADGKQVTPDLSGYGLAWTDFRSALAPDGGDIWTEDIRVGSEVSLGPAPGGTWHPRVSGDWVVYEQRTARGDNDIYAHRLSDPTGPAIPICTNSANQTAPAIWGNIVVWQDDRDGLSSVYGYDMTALREFKVSDTNWAYDFAPDVSQDTVVFERWENVNPDVYGATLSFSKITGKVTLSNYVGDPQALPLELLLWPIGSSTPVRLPIRLDSDGSFTAVTLLAGIYEIGMKPSHWIQQIQPNWAQLDPAKPLSVTFKLVNGDLTHDNVVDLRDLAGVLTAYSRTGVVEADLDGDGTVGLRDLAVVLGSFGQRGDNP